MNPYWNWLKKNTPIDERLRWCHVTDTYALRSIIDSGKLLPKTCPVFQKDLTYLFYGRAAYRFREHEQIRLSSKAPVVCVFSNTLEREGTLVYPFDTGAFNGRYKQWLHPDMALSDFAMPCREHAPERQVGAFFGSPTQYLSMSPTSPSLDYTGEFEVEAVAELLLDPSSESSDDRRLSIELQVNKTIDFAPPLLTALVIPDRLRKADWFDTWLRSIPNPIEILCYELNPRRLASHYQSELESRTKELVFEGTRAHAPACV